MSKNTVHIIMKTIPYEGSELFEVYGDEKLAQHVLTALNRNYTGYTNEIHTKEVLQ